MSRALKSLAIFFAFAVIFTISRHYADAKSSTTTTTTGTSSSTTVTTIAGAMTCEGRDFTGVFNEGEGAAGTILASVTLTKNTAGSCTVKGYPLLTLQDLSGSVLASRTLDSSPVQFPATKANEPPTLVSVSDGMSINFSLGYSDVPEGNETCASVTSLAVQFASGASSVSVTPSYALQPCNNATLWVSPFY